MAVKSAVASISVTNTCRIGAENIASVPAAQHTRGPTSIQSQTILTGFTSKQLMKVGQNGEKIKRVRHLERE
jgi:hypothetical protein